MLRVLVFSHSEKQKAGTTGASPTGAEAFWNCMDEFSVGTVVFHSHWSGAEISGSSHLNKGLWIADRNAMNLLYTRLQEEHISAEHHANPFRKTARCCNAPSSGQHKTNLKPRCSSCNT